MTDDELRALLDGATPGEWDATALRRESAVCTSGGALVADCVTDADARLIAAAPDLAREVLELRAKVRDYEAPLPVGDLARLAAWVDPRRMQGHAIPAAAAHAAIDLRHAYAPGIRVVAAVSLPNVGVAEGDVGDVQSWHGDEVTVRYLRANGATVTYSASTLGSLVRLHEVPR